VKRKSSRHGNRLFVGRVLHWGGGAGGTNKQTNSKKRQASNTTFLPLGLIKENKKGVSFSVFTGRPSIVPMKS